MKADAHRRPASSLERAIALASADPTTSVAILENAWGAAYHWISYGCIQKYQQHRDLAPRLKRLSRGPRRSEVQEALDLLERIRTLATTEIGRFS